MSVPWIQAAESIRVSTYTAGRAGVGLDAATVLAVNHLRVLECDTINSVVALPTDGANAETVATKTVNIVNCDLSSAGNRNTVILVVHIDVLKGNVVTRRDVKTVAVVSSWLATTSRVRRESCGVVQNKTREDDVLAASDIKAVDRPVHDVQAGYMGVVSLLDDDEVVGPWYID